MRNTNNGFWNALDPTEREQLRGMGRPQTYRAGMALCYEGEPSSHLFVLLSGLVKIMVTTEDGHEVMLAIRGAGDLVGEQAALEDEPRTATVYALETVQALVFAADRFVTFLDTNPQAWRILERITAARLKESDRTRKVYPATSGAQRLAQLLLDLLARYGTRTAAGEGAITLNLTQQELASWVGVSRETVARALKDWRDRGLVRTGSRTITIVNTAGLRRIAVARRSDF